MVDVHNISSNSTSGHSTSAEAGGVRDKMEVVAFHLSNHLENIQTRSSSLAHSVNHKMHVLYGDAVDWIENINLLGKLTSIWETTTAKGQELVNIFRQNGFHIQLSRYLAEAKGFLKNEVSKQAIYFGFFGLVTGGVVGLVIGYSFKYGSSSSHNSVSNGPGNLMRAIRCIRSSREIDGITLSTISVPHVIRPDDVLIQVKAVSIDNIDARIACGYRSLLRKHMGLPFAPEPFVLGRECSGVVLEAGSQVTSFDTNDRVWVCLPIWASQGVMSEYIVVPEQYVGHKPKNVGFEGAATLPYACLVVWQNIVSKSQLGPQTTKNKRVLIHLGATSKNDGVGLLATQVLKSWGARVTISTEENTEEESLNGSGVAQMTFLHSLKSLGAESHIIIPNDETLLPDLSQRIFDVVINSDSPEVTPLLQNFARDPEGSVIETFPEDLDTNPWRIVSFVSAAIKTIFRRVPAEPESSRSSLEECKKLVESGVVVPVVARSFLASQYDQAFRHVSTHSSNSALAHAHIGKSVIVFRY